MFEDKQEIIDFCNSNFFTKLIGFFDCNDTSAFLFIFITLIITIIILISLLIVIFISKGKYAKEINDGEKDGTN